MYRYYHWIIPIHDEKEDPRDGNVITPKHQYFIRFSRSRNILDVSDYQTPLALKVT